LRNNRALFSRENTDSSRTKDDDEDEAKIRNLGFNPVAPSIHLPLWHHLHFPNRKLAKKVSTLFDRESQGGYCTGESPGLMNNYFAGRDNLAGYRAVNFYQLGSDRVHHLRVTFLFDVDSLCLDTATQLTLEVDPNRASADQIATHGSLDLSRTTKCSSTNEVALVGDNQATPRPNGSSVDAANFVVLQIDVCAALWTEGRRSTFRDLTLSRALEAPGKKCALNAKQPRYILKDRNRLAFGLVQCRWFSAFFQLDVTAAFAAVSRFRQFSLELKVAAMGTLYFDSPFGIFHFLECRRVNVFLVCRGRLATFLQQDVTTAFAAIGRLSKLGL
jgi:hypothetical protein